MISKQAYPLPLGKRVWGVALGLIGGYYGGRTDAVVLWIYSTFASIPSLLFISLISK